MVNRKEKINACLLLGSYLDTLGFKNTKWEFNYYKDITNINVLKSVWLDIIHEYFILGGENISLKNWKASDDTILMIATARAVIEGGGIKKYIENYLKIKDLLDDSRAPGNQTLKSLDFLKINQNIKIKDLSTTELMGGNGAAIRSASIGIKWYDNIDKLIEEALISSRLTHNHALGFLGGLVTALFTSYALNDINPKEWLNKLLELYESNKINSYLLDYKNKNKIKYFFYFWYKYREERINKIDELNSATIFPQNRILELVTYSPIYNELKDKETFHWGNLGGTGIDVLIYAYDSLLISKNNWSTLKFLSALNTGDSDSTGIIAGCWYGALYGFDNVDKEKMKELEFYKELDKLSNLF